MTGPQRITNPNSPIVQMGPPPEEHVEAAKQLRTPPGAIGYVVATADFETDDEGE